MDNIKVSGFRAVPLFAQGLVRDLRVRWALEELNMDYAVDLIDFADKQSSSYIQRHPFGLVPAFEADGRQLFESGAILYEVGCLSARLMPLDSTGRADTLAWMFAALNTVEPSIQALSVIDLQQDQEAWAQLRRPAAVEAVQLRLAQLSAWLEGREYLTGRFTVADILMTSVLRLIRHTDLVEAVEAVNAYKLRCEARPAFQKALERQLGDYKHSASVSA